MGLFDDPEMQLIGFEQAGINNAKHYAPQQDKFGLLHPPSFDVKLDTLSGAPTRYIHWGPTGAETGNYHPNIDPTMAKFFRESGSPAWINLSPDQDPLFRNEEWLRTRQLYENMSPEEIRKLHYTDAASFPATSENDIAHKARMASLSEAYLERQKAIQDFRIGNRNASELARRLEIMGAQQRIYSVAKWGEEQNSRYLTNLKKVIKENPGLGDALDQKMFTPESFVEKYGVPTRSSLELPPANIMKERRAEVVDMIDQWGNKTKKAGLTPDEFTGGRPGYSAGSQKFRTGGFLLGLGGVAGEIGMISRLLRGGQWSEEDGNVDVRLPSELNSPDERLKKMYQEGVYTNEDGSILL